VLSFHHVGPTAKPFLGGLRKGDPLRGPAGPRNDPFLAKKSAPEGLGRPSPGGMNVDLARSGQMADPLSTERMRARADRAAYVVHLLLKRREAAPTAMAPMPSLTGIWKLCSSVRDESCMGGGLGTIARGGGIALYSRGVRGRPQGPDPSGQESSVSRWA
jgi:hypothetical protein